MLIQSSLLQWLLELEIPLVELPIETFHPGDGGLVDVGPDAQASLVNGKGTWAIVARILKSRSVSIPDTNPLNSGNTALVRLHNWSFIERLLSTIGFELDPDLKALAVAGDVDTVNKILNEIRRYCQGGKAETTQDDTKRDGREIRRSKEEEHDLPSEREERRQALVPPPDVTPPDKPPPIADAPSSSHHGGAPAPPEPSFDHDVAVAARVGAIEADDLIASNETSTSASGSESCAQFFVKSLSKGFGVPAREVLVYLIDDGDVIEDWIVRGHPTGDFNNAMVWLNIVITRITDLCFHIASEPSTLPISLRLLACGIKSKNRQVALMVCLALKQTVEVLEKYFLWKSCYTWFTGNQGPLTAIAGLVRAFPDEEVCASAADVLCAFYRENFGEFFVNHAERVHRRVEDQVRFSRELFLAMVSDGTIQERIREESQAVLFQYHTQLLRKGPSEDAASVICGTMITLCKVFPLQPVYDTELDILLNHIKDGCHSGRLGIRHEAVFHLLDLLEINLGNTNRQSFVAESELVLTRMIGTSHEDDFVYATVLVRVERLMGQFKFYSFEACIDRVVTTIAEKRTISSLELRALNTYVGRDALSKDKAINILKVLTHVTGIGGPNAIASRRLVVKILERIGRHDDVVRHLNQRYGKVLSKKFRKSTSDFLNKIEDYLHQKENSHFGNISRSLLQQFQETIDDDEYDEPSTIAKTRMGMPTGSAHGTPASVPKRKAKAESAPKSTPRERRQSGAAIRQRLRDETPQQPGARSPQTHDEKKVKRVRKRSILVAQKPSQNVQKRYQKETPQKPREENAPPKKRNPGMLRDLNERRRREIEEIKAKREEEKRRLEAKALEKHLREEELRLKLKRRRDRLASKPSAQKRAGGPETHGPYDEMDAEIIDELIIEALNKRLESNVQTPMPKGFHMSLKSSYFSRLVDQYRDERGDEYANSFQMCMGILCDMLVSNELIEIEDQDSFFGRAVAKRDAVAPSLSPPQEVRSKKARTPGRGKATPASGAPRARKAKDAPGSKKKARAAKERARSPQDPKARAIKHAVDAMLSLCMDAVKERGTLDAFSVPSPSPSAGAGVRGKDTPATSKGLVGGSDMERDGHLKYSEMKKEEAAKLREKKAREKMLAEAEEAKRRKARGEFLKKKLEKQRVLKEEKERERLEAIRRKKAEEEEARRKREERERAYREAQKAKVKKYQQSKAKEIADLNIQVSESRVASDGPIHCMSLIG